MLNNDPYIKLCREIAEQAHEGQTRRGGDPYITHPKWVAEALYKATSDYPINSQRRYDALRDSICIAWLHDVLEDCPEWTAERLFSLSVPERVVKAVIAITHLKGEDPDVYMDRVLENPLAALVKMWDIQHNLSCQPSEKAKARYAISMKRFEAFLGSYKEEKKKSPISKFQVAMFVIGILFSTALIYAYFLK